MAVFRKLRLSIGNYLLNRRLKKVKREKRLIGFESAKSVGVLFKTLNRNEFEEIRKFLHFLSENNSKVYALGFVDHKKIPDFYLLSKGLNFFTRKELNIYFIPRSNSASEFIQKPLDILVDLSIDNNFPLYYLSCMSKAKLKIGKSSAKNDCYDLMFDTSKNNSVAALIEHIKHYTAVLTTS